MSKKRTLRLLAGGSVLALSGGASGAAQADGIELFIEGQYYWSGGTRQIWAERGPFGAPPSSFDTQEIDVTDGWGGRIGVRFPVSDRWDVAAIYTGLQGAENKAALGSVTYPTLNMHIVGSYRYANYAGMSARIDNKLHMGDFEVGYNVGLGSRAKLRVLGGVRIIGFNQNLQVAGDNVILGTFLRRTETKKSSYLGAGPRLGVSGKVRLARIGSGKLFLTGGVGGAVMFGRTENNISVQTMQPPFGPGTVLTYSDSKGQTAYSMDARMGFAYAFPLFGVTGKIGAGYSFDGFWNMVNTRGQMPISVAGFANGSQRTIGTTGGNTYLHGPYVRLTIKFSAYPEWVAK